MIGDYLVKYCVLLYILYVNDLPAAVHDHSENSSAQLDSRSECTECGMLCCYVDDSTYSYASKDPQQLSMMLDKQYKSLANYFRNNRLVINDGKTHLLVIGRRGQKHMRERVAVNTGTFVIEPTESEKLIWLNIHQSLTWKHHLRDGENSVLKNLNKRLNAIKTISYHASFKTRLMLANGGFMSLVTYMIAVWGNSEKYLIRMVQVLQNKAARYVTKLSWYTPSRTLLKRNCFSSTVLSEYFIVVYLVLGNN